jgi:cyclophilin family peptidyl-prolyl cis-trans isomerase
MRLTIVALMLALFGLAMFTGCPRDTASDDAQKLDTSDVAGAVGSIDSTEGTQDAAHGEGGLDLDSTSSEDSVDSAAEGDEPGTSELGGDIVTDTGTDNITTVVLETTKGDIVLELHESWAPLGYAHFLELVNAGFYDGAPWFRVVDGFVAQCGVSADPALNAQWGQKTIMDEAVVVGNKPGFVSFGKSRLPNSRSTHVFINYKDNSSGLDTQGFSCFAQVVEGFDVAQELYRCEWGDQFGLGQEGGLATFKQAHPDADFIVKAYVR